MLGHLGEHSQNVRQTIGTNMNKTLQNPSSKKRSHSFFSTSHTTQNPLPQRQVTQAKIFSLSLVGTKSPAKDSGRKIGVRSDCWCSGVLEAFLSKVKAYLGIVSGKLRDLAALSQRFPSCTNSLYMIQQTQEHRTRINPHKTVLVNLHTTRDHLKPLEKLQNHRVSQQETMQTPNVQRPLLSHQRCGLSWSGTSFEGSHRPKERSHIASTQVKAMSGQRRREMSNAISEIWEKK